jgi:hypothetical protein
MVISSREASANDDTYIGKWYSEGVEACKTEPGTNDNGLIAYTQREFIGYENSCDIKKIVFDGAKVKLSGKCSGEGETTAFNETVEIVGSKLKRSWREGRKNRFFTYNRCP